MLSDSLTECGYPWELIVVDRGSRDQTAELLGAWAELPGVRSLRLKTQASQADGLAAGLVAARGDAVLLCDPAFLHAPELIPRMVQLWETDAMLVHATPDPDTGISLLTPWDEALTRRRIAQASFTLPSGCTKLGLLDRQLVEWMLDVQP